MTGNARSQHRPIPTYTNKKTKKKKGKIIGERRLNF